MLRYRTVGPVDIQTVIDQIVNSDGAIHVVAIVSSARACCNVAVIVEPDMEAAVQGEEVS